MLAYYEVCQEQRNGGWTKEKDEVGAPYMYKKDQWIGYEDSVYVTKKVNFIFENYCLNIDTFLFSFHTRVENCTIQLIFCIFRLS